MLFTFNAGAALWPIHFQVVPFFWSRSLVPTGGGLSHDEEFFETISSARSHPSLGDTNVRRPFDSSTLGRRSCVSQRLHIWAFQLSTLLAAWAKSFSNHEGYSRTGASNLQNPAFPEKSFRTDWDEGEEGLFLRIFLNGKYALADINKGGDH